MTNYLGEEDSLQTEYTLAGRPFKHVISRLDSLLMVLKSCKGQECHEPWVTLHPKSNIKNLKQALESDYDVFYESQPKVSYSSCQLGYLVDAEGPQHVNSYKEEPSYQLVDQGSNSGQRESFRYKGELGWWT